jgi:hypothetical protein
MEILRRVSLQQATLLNASDYCQELYVELLYTPLVTLLSARIWLLRMLHSSVSIVTGPKARRWRNRFVAEPG